MEGTILRRTLAAVAAITALLAFAAPASATGTSSHPATSLLKPGHPKGVVPHFKGPAASSSGSVGTNPICTGCHPPLIYHAPNPVAGGISHTSGPVGAVTITPYFWDPAGYSYSASYRTIVNQYLADLQADSGKPSKPSNVFAVANQYYQTYNGSTQPLRYAITAGAEIDDTTAFPATQTLGHNANGCDPALPTDACVSDLDLRQRLEAEILNHFPADDSHVYAVFFPNHVETCMGPGSAATGQQCSSKAYCAYHDGDQPNPNANTFILYANEPYPDLTGCVGSPGSQTPNGDAEADAVLSSLSHEANETITDAFGAWNDSPNAYENGDECAYVYGNTLGGLPGAFYNQVINGHHYWTQTEFSNQDFALSQGDPLGPNNPAVVYGCRQREDLPAAAFAPPTAILNTPATFNGSPSTDSDSSVSYSWSWGDGSPNGSGATPTHTFTSAGTFNVTLTATSVDGWSGSITHPVAVAATGLYTVDGFGGVHADGSAPLASTTYWPGWKIAHTGKTLPVTSGAPQTGFVLDGWGGLHRFGAATITETSPSGGHYWQGWDIARDFAFLPDGTGGFVLDGYGGLHPFHLNGDNRQLQATGNSYFGFDIARKVVIFPDASGGYVLDGWGGLHPFGINGAAPTAASHLTGIPYWPGWDIARGLVLTPGNGGLSGYVLDGYGGAHPFHPTTDSSLMPAPISGTYFGFDIARSIWLDGASTAAAPRGLVMNGYGQLFSFGSEPVPAGPSWPGWDIAVGLAGQ